MRNRNAAGSLDCHDHSPVMLQPAGIVLLFGMATKLSCFLEMPSEVLSAVVCELRDFLGPVGRIGPSMVLPVFTDISQGDFREHPITQIQSVVPVFGRREHQFRLRHVAWVEVQRSLFFVLGGLDIILFPAVGCIFPVGQTSRINKA